MDKLNKGAKTAIEQCIEVTAPDKVYIVTDLETNHIGIALSKAALKKTKKVKLVVIEDYTERPAQELPTALVKDVRGFKPTVSIYAAQGQTGELQKFRGPLKDIFVYELKCRHAHMIGITTPLMEGAMNQDFDLVNRVTNNVYQKVKRLEVDKINIKDNYETDLTAVIDNSKLNWIPSDGHITPTKWGNLPTGETFTSPVTANGTYAGWVLGDELIHYGVLDQPLIVTIDDGYVTEVTIDTSASEKTTQAKKDFEKYIAEHENGNRIGEFAIGTLVGLTEFCGNLLQDEKFPGSHIAFGHPYNVETGQTWDAPTHIDIIARDVTITIFYKDGSSEVIMKDGTFIDEILND